MRSCIFVCEFLLCIRELLFSECVQTFACMCALIIWTNFKATQFIKLIERVLHHNTWDGILSKSLEHIPITMSVIPSLPNSLDRRWQTSITNSLHGYMYLYGFESNVCSLAGLLARTYCAYCLTAGRTSLYMKQTTTHSSSNVDVVVLPFSSVPCAKESIRYSGEDTGEGRCVHRVHQPPPGHGSRHCCSRQAGGVLN